MGNSTMPNMTRGRVTTPKPQQGARGNQLIRPPAATLRPPMPKVNPPMAPYGGLNLNPMPNPQPPRIVPTPVPNPPAMRGPGFDDTTPSIQDPNNPIVRNPLQQVPFQDPNNPSIIPIISGQNPQPLIQDPNQISNIGVSQPMSNPIYDDQGNLMNYDASSMSMFNPNMMMKPY